MAYPVRLDNSQGVLASHSICSIVFLCVFGFLPDLFSTCCLSSKNAAVISRCSFAHIPVARSLTSLKICGTSCGTFVNQGFLPLYLSRQSWLAGLPDEAGHIVLRGPTWLLGTVYPKRKTNHRHADTGSFHDSILRSRWVSLPEPRRSPDHLSSEETSSAPSRGAPVWEEFCHKVETKSSHCPWQCLCSYHSGAVAGTVEFRLWAVLSFLPMAVCMQLPCFPCLVLVSSGCSALPLDTKDMQSGALGMWYAL